MPPAIHEVKLAVHQVTAATSETTMMHTTDTIDDWYNITADLTDIGNSTTEGTFAEFLLFRIEVPLWEALAAAVAVLVLCLALCITLYIRSCCCQQQQKKQLKGAKLTEKDPLILVTSRNEKSAEEDGESIGSSSKSYGKLHYTLDYDAVKQTLYVGVIEASDIPAMDAGGTSDPYIKVTLLPDAKKKFKTKVLSKTLNPQYNEFFNFPVEFTKIGEKSLHFTVFDHDRFSKDDMIGQLVVPFAQLNFLEGSIETWADIIGPESDESEPQHLGDICFTLQYVPSTRKLTAIIIECKDLVPDADLPIIYVKVELMREGKRLKKAKTTKREGTLNPYFNEAFTFDVIPADLYVSTIVVSVLRRGRHGTGLTRVGQVELDNKAQGPPYRHWSDMLRQPRRSVASWHTLQQPNDNDD